MTAVLVLALYLALVIAATTGVTGHVPALLLRSEAACPKCQKPHLLGPSWARR